MTKLWTNKLEGDFHRAVETLRGINETPSEAESYRLQELPHGGDDGQYTLHPKDELQLANHIAFLAHATEGASAVSAVCLEEPADDGDSGGLVVRLASNEAAKPAIITGLEALLLTVSEGARSKTPHDALRDTLFEKVLDVSYNRILQRVSSRRAVARLFHRQSEESLRVRLEKTITDSSVVCMAAKRTQTQNLVAELTDIVSALKRVDQHAAGAEQRAALRDVVRACAAISYGASNGSLEQRLRKAKLLSPDKTLKAKDVAQIDKVARYSGLCRDLATLARQRAYRRLLAKPMYLHVVPAADYPSSRRIGTGSTCHVHAEIQLVLYYEQRAATAAPIPKPPRCMGCSKWACFLCDLFLRRLGRYRISNAHRRLYNRWTLPDVDWLPEDRVRLYQSILAGMTADMRKLAQKNRHRRNDGQYIPESRAISLLSFRMDVSTASSTSVATLTAPPATAVQSALPEEQQQQQQQQGQGQEQEREQEQDQEREREQSAPQSESASSSSTTLSARSHTASAASSKVTTGSEEQGVSSSSPATASKTKATADSGGQPAARRIYHALPCKHPFSASGDTVHLHLQGLFLVLECPASTGVLHVRETETAEAAVGSHDGDQAKVACIHINDLSEVNTPVSAAVGPSSTQLQLQISPTQAIEIEFIWLAQHGDGTG
ncbi:hypothetical protein SPI_04396 [Niveomyces insectorum RCEF 264]|uniref:Uncharacterized protein n=1 Tax=Niveomyces insectorum RCEF 264 TaxID=1081102 RepID=A0A167VPM3_9HYPO|nr:hypothetical protein SPI_04396 [Niveomyces insectorum RCEF 264]